MAHSDQHSPMLQFDFSEPHESAAPCRFLDPEEVVTAHRLDDVLPALRRVQKAVDNGYYAAGFVAYEAAPAFDSAMVVPPAGEMPLVWFGVYRTPSPIPEEAPEEEYAAGDWECAVGSKQFARQVTSIREGIAAGEFYQVNHTLRLRAPFQGDAFAWYRQLREAQHGAFSAFLDLGRFQILSLSPELFFRTEAILPPIQTMDGTGRVVARKTFPGSAAPGIGRQILTRPMKGTYRRGRWPAEDRVFQTRLHASEKDCAENLMIVDLLRNDLGRIAEIGSVRVEELFQVERYPTLLQMTSTVAAQLRAGAGLTEILCALFPCGSVTGAPKISAMRRIATLEPDPRQAYCGAIGVAEPGGRIVFNVAIRTVVIDRNAGVAEYGIGSGITWDSDAKDEYEEIRLKAAILRAPVDPPDLFETIRLENGDFVRVERHLARLLDSADYFDITIERAALRAALDRQARERPDGIWRVRLRLSKTGSVETDCELLDCPSDRPRTFALVSEPVARGDYRLYHKTTDRTLYHTRKAQRPDVYDVLLRNQEGELTEFTTGSLLVEMNGALYMPPLDCGLLPGILRSEILENGLASERALFTADLARATGIWLVNSLRGRVPMRYVRD